MQSDILKCNCLLHVRAHMHAPVIWAFYHPYKCAAFLVAEDLWQSACTRLLLQLLAVQAAPETQVLSAT